MFDFVELGSSTVTADIPESWKDIELTPEAVVRTCHTAGAYLDNEARRDLCERSGF